MDYSNDICDSCGNEGAKLPCETCSRFYHDKCFKHSQASTEHSSKKCYKCINYGSKSIQIAEFVTSHDENGKEQITPKIYSDRIAKVIKEGDALDLPVLIISVAGVARSGKSFLLTLLLDRNIHHIERGQHDWTKSNNHISGFHWAQSDTAVTFGIWMWEKAIVTTLNDGSKVAILYVDTQGTGDRVESTDPAIDTLIMYLSLEIATIQIHNINQLWRVEDTRIYEVCKLYGELCTKGEQKPFNSLVLMHRNWQNDNEYGWRLNYYDKEVEKVAKNEVALATLKGIKASFQSVDFAMLPTPGSKVTQSRDKLTIQDIKAKFLVSLESFFDVLYNQKHSFKKSVIRCKRGKDVIRVVKELKDRMEKEDLPPIGTPADHLADSMNSQAYTTAMAQFDEDMSKIAVGDDIHKYIEKLDKAVMNSKETYQSVAVKQDNFKKAFRLYEKKLNDDLSTKKDSLVRTVELTILKKNAEELRLQNLLEKEFQESLLAWEKRMKSITVNEKRNLALYKKKLTDLSAETLNRFTGELKKHGYDNKSLSDQLRQTFQQKEDDAMKMAENEKAVLAIQKELVQRRMEQEKKNKEFEELQKRQREGEQISKEQQKQLDDYKKYKDDQEKITKELQAQLSQKKEEEVEERIRKEMETQATLKKVEEFDNKVKKLEDQLEDTKDKLFEQQDLYLKSSSARGPPQESMIGDGIRVLASGADRVASWVTSWFQ